jgi:DNA-directed RNA polymerase omega subunit
MWWTLSPRKKLGILIEEFLTEAGGAAALMSPKEEIEEIVEETQAPEIDSKYRLIILAAKRSKQLQRGARPRIDIDALKHKNTRIALEEVMRGRVNFKVTNNGTGEE